MRVDRTVGPIDEDIALIAVSPSEYGKVIASGYTHAYPAYDDKSEALLVYCKPRWEAADFFMVTFSRTRRVTMSRDIAVANPSLSFTFAGPTTLLCVTDREQSYILDVSCEEAIVSKRLWTCDYQGRDGGALLDWSHSRS